MYAYIILQLCISMHGPHLHQQREQTWATQSSCRVMQRNLPGSTLFTHTSFTPFLSLSLSSLSLSLTSHAISLLFITWNLCRGINNNSCLHLLVDCVKQRQEKEGAGEGTAVACLPQWGKIATVTELVKERWKESGKKKGGKCEVRERCIEGGWAGNTKRKDERRQKTRDRKRGSDGRVGVLPPLLVASRLCSPACMNFWSRWLWGLEIPAGCHAKEKEGEWKKKRWRKKKEWKIQLQRIRVRVYCPTMYSLKMELEAMGSWTGSRHIVSVQKIRWWVKCTILFLSFPIKVFEAVASHLHDLSLCETWRNHVTQPQQDQRHSQMYKALKSDYREFSVWGSPFCPS